MAMLVAITAPWLLPVSGPSQASLIRIDESVTAVSTFPRVSRNLGLAIGADGQRPFWVVIREGLFGKGGKVLGLLQRILDLLSTRLVRI